MRKKSTLDVKTTLRVRRKVWRRYAPTAWPESPGLGGRDHWNTQPPYNGDTRVFRALSVVLSALTNLLRMERLC